MVFVFMAPSLRSLMGREVSFETGECDHLEVWAL